MTLQSVADKTAFLIVHVTLFELPLVILVAALASWRLATVLQKHDARQREANLARNVAIFYLILLGVAVTLAQVLG